jgi:hypothetical protein
MIPNFALLLSEDGIVLLHRQSDGKTWANKGEIALDGSDLPKGLRRLCEIARTLAGGAFTTKLLLPESQLLYAQVSVSENAQADIRAALEDRTPYSADDLIYDMSGTGGTRQVVAVARETLKEAEAFLGSFGFSPAGFSTIPPKGTFEGEPNLGGFAGRRFVTDADAVVIGPEITAPPPLKSSEPETVQEPVKPEPAKAQTTPPAAFSSRRRSDDPITDATSKRLSKRAPRIALPDAPSKSSAPKVVAPSRNPDPDFAASTIKAPTPAKAPPPIIPAVVADLPAPKPSALSRLTRRKPPQGDSELDPIAAYAAKQQAGKPRYLGLILTVALIAALGLFALLSSFLLPEGGIARWFDGEGEPQVEVVAVEDEEASDLEEFELSSLPDDVTLPDALPPLDEDITVDQDTTPEPVPTVQTDTTSSPTGPLNETQAQTAYAATGIWQRAPDFASVTRADGLDDLYVASLDPNPAFEDAPALPAQPLAAGDALMPAPKAPPPPGVRYDLDERGLVRATPQGALSPEGVIVIAGRPPVAPVRRDNTTVPNDLAPAIIEDPAPEEVEAPLAEVLPESAPTTSNEPFADPALAAFKPRQRPSDIAERIERVNLGGRSRSELAGFRPNQRPQAILDAATAVAAAQAVEEAARAEAIAAAVEEATQTPDIPATGNASLVPLDAEPDTNAEVQIAAATALAVPRSVKPRTRPRGFESIVASARRAPTTAPEPDVQTASAATASTNRSSGPAVARASRGRSSGPVSNTVARAATDNNAIALGQVALVGVFGTTSNRRALVRLPSGRFKKVSVGDRVDGGKVNAIGASELKYTKSGRTLTLKMPKG